MSENRQPPKLLDRVRIACRARHYSPRTEDAYAAWAERFIRFHKIRHPDTMAEPEVNAFLTHLAVDRDLAPPPRTRRWRRCCSSTAPCSAAPSTS